MREHWINLVKTAAIAEPTQVVQERKMHLGQVWKVPGLAWAAGFPITPRQLGYQPNSTKLTQLTRTYFNQESLEAANRKLVSRIKAGKTQTSVGASLVAGGKREESQGHCMRAITVNHFRNKDWNHLSVHIFYRTTEVIQKFAADLWFLQEKVFPTLLKDVNVPLSEVRFYFTVLSFSPLFLPVLYNFVDPVEFLEEVRKGDPGYFQKVLFRTKAPLQAKKGYYKFRTRRQMHDLLLRLIEEGKIDRKRLERYINEHI